MLDDQLAIFFTPLLLRRFMTFQLKVLELPVLNKLERYMEAEYNY
jgi:hypothetical protein